VRAPYRPKNPISRFRRRFTTPDRDALRKVEVDLLRRQTRASYIGMVTTAAITAALVWVSFLQWRTAESTAAIERAKARPHFRIRQENQEDELGFLPRRFIVQPDAGVSDATEATAASIMLIHYTSNDLHLAGTCRAYFENFYGWTNDAMSFEINDAANRLMVLSRTPDKVSESFIRIQPLWVLVGISYMDIFSAAGEQKLLLFAGQPMRLGRTDFESNARAGMRLVLLLDNQGKVVLYRVGPTPRVRNVQKHFG
jgi:hypothetical protein